MKRTPLKRGPAPTRKTATTVERVCTTCGATFLFKTSQLNHYKGGGQFCSRACSYKGIAARHSDKPIVDRYGRSSRKADKDWRSAVREKDNYTCQRCGVYDHNIHTHHVATRAQRPDLRHDVANGKCLCPPCHMWVHHNPIEAHAAGLLSDAKYEASRLGQRYQNAGAARRLPLDEAAIVAAHRSGKRAKAIARELGVSNSPIKRILQEHGCPPHPTGSPGKGSR